MTHGMITHVFFVFFSILRYFLKRLLKHIYQLQYIFFYLGILLDGSDNWQTGPFLSQVKWLIFYDYQHTVQLKGHYADRQAMIDKYWKELYSLFQVVQKRSMSRNREMLGLLNNAVAFLFTLSHSFINQSYIIAGLV